MDKIQKLYNFSNLKFKKEIADDFKQYAQSHNKNYTDTLEIFLEFFKQNNFKLKDKFSDSLISVQNESLERIKYTLSTVKNVEKLAVKRYNKLMKNQAALLNHLMITQAEKPLKNIDDIFPEESQISDSEKEEKIKNTVKEVLLFLEKIERQKQKFGEPIFKIKTSTNELIALKRKLKNI